MSPQLHDGVKGVGVKGQRTERQGLLSSFFKSEGILQKGGGFGRDDDVKTNLHTPSTTKVNDETGVQFCTVLRLSPWRLNVLCWFTRAFVQPMEKWRNLKGYSFIILTSWHVCWAKVIFHIRFLFFLGCKTVVVSSECSIYIYYNI